MIYFMSGTNKSGALKTVLDEFNAFEQQQNSDATFECGTLEGLMTDLKANNNTALGIFDEFSTFKDNLDKGNSGSAEKGRYLSLFNASNWSKSTKGPGKAGANLIDPRFQLISYTQPFYACNFGRQNTSDGFFQRFLTTLPKEVFVELEEKEEKILSDSQNLIVLADVFSRIYSQCKKAHSISLVLDSEAYDSYKDYHDGVVAFRKSDLYEEEKVYYYL